MCHVGCRPGWIVGTCTEGVLWWLQTELRAQEGIWVAPAGGPARGAHFQRRGDPRNPGRISRTATPRPAPRTSGDAPVAPPGHLGGPGWCQVLDR